MKKNYCYKCEKEIIGNICPRCDRKKNNGEIKQEDFRGGLCHYNYHGEYCPLTGACSSEIAGRTTKWFCSYHVRCINTEEGKEIIMWAKENLKEILNHQKFPPLNEKPTFRRTIKEN